MGWTFSGADTSFTVSSWFVWQGEFSQISSDHVEFDFNWVEELTVVNSDDASNHFWHNDAVSEMGFDYSGFLSGKTVLFSLNAFHVESVISMFNFSSESSSLPGSEEFNNFFGWEFIDLFRGKSSERILLNSLLFLCGCGH